MRSRRQTLPEEPPIAFPAFGEIMEGRVLNVSEEEVTVLAHDLVGTITLPDILWAERRLSEGASVTEAEVTPIVSARQLVQPGDVIEVSLKSTSNDTIRFPAGSDPPGRRRAYCDRSQDRGGSSDGRRLPV